MIPFYKQKTTITGLAAILGAVAAYLAGEMALDVAIQIVVTALLGIFLRQGVEKNNPNQGEEK